jgi:hypothetical protein
LSIEYHRSSFVKLSEIHVFTKQSAQDQVHEILARRHDLVRTTRCNRYYGSLSGQVRIARSVDGDYFYRLRERRVSPSGRSTRLLIQLLQHHDRAS